MRIRNTSTRHFVYPTPRMRKDGLSHEPLFLRPGLNDVEVPEEIREEVFANPGLQKQIASGVLVIEKE
jgi:hypothetical protein